MQDPFFIVQKEVNDTVGTDLMEERGGDLAQAAPSLLLGKSIPRCSTLITSGSPPRSYKACRAASTSCGPFLPRMATENRCKPSSRMTVAAWSTW